MPVTVVVSARNEARDLPRCIASLLALDYPRHSLQIVLVNDFSTDDTGRIIDAAAAAHAHVVALHSATLAANNLEAKARGVAHAFAAATGEWVCITDADGAVAPEWIRHLLGRVTAHTGMCGGALLVQPSGWLGRVERMSWAFLQTFSAGLAGFGAPIACLGPNMAIRKSVYDAAGGLERAQNFRVAEDLALFTMVTSRKLDVHSYMDAETTVTLTPVPSAQHLFSQHRRWLGGGIDQGWTYTVPLFIALWWGFGLILWLMFGWLAGWQGWLVCWVIKLAVDYTVLRLQQSRLRLHFHTRYLWVLELYHLVMVTLLPVSFLATRRIEWRGDGYAVRYN